MRIPTRQEFAPLPEAIDMLGLPDPLEVLPALENQLEAVETSNAQIRAVTAGLRSAAADLEAEAGAVEWEGAAAGQFRSKTAEIAQSFRNAADNIADLAVRFDEISAETKELIRKILESLGIVVTVVLAAILAGLSGAALIAAVVGTIILLIAVWLDEFLWLIQRIWEGIQWLIEQLTSPPTGHPVPSPSPMPRPTPPPEFS